MLEEVVEGDYSSLCKFFRACDKEGLIEKSFLVYHVNPRGGDWAAEIPFFVPNKDFVPPPEQKEKHQLLALAFFAINRRTQLLCTHSKCCGRQFFRWTMMGMIWDGRR